MRNRRQLVQRARIMHQNIQPTEAFHNGRPDHINILLGLLQIKGQQRRGLAAGAADGVIHFFKPALGARDQHALRAKLGQFQGECRANAA